MWVLSEISGHPFVLIRRPKILLSYWTLSIVFTSLDLARLSKLDELNPAKGSQYPSSDKVVDNAVLVCSALHDGNYLVT